MLAAVFVTLIKDLQQQKDLVLNPIHLVTKKGLDLFRLILDLRKMNLGIDLESFKMETLLNTIKILKPGTWATKIDLSKGYYHIPIHPNSRKLLGFIWNNQFYHFNVLPFGLSSAPRIFTKIMKQVVKKWRFQGMIIFIYIDDILILSFMGKEHCRMQTLQVLADMKYLGFMIQPSKCILEPTQSIEYLGLQLDFLNGKVLIPQQKKEIALERINQMTSMAIMHQSISCRKIAQFLGKIEFLSKAEKAIPVFCYRLKRSMNSIVQKKGWSATMRIFQNCLKDLKILKTLIQNSQGTPFELSWDLKRIYTDSSLQGFGAIQNNNVLGSLNSTSTYQREGIDNSFGFPKGSSSITSLSSKNSIPSNFRQYNSSFLSQEGLWSSGFPSNNCKENMETFNETRMVHTESELYSNNGKCHSRSPIEDGRMGNFSRVIQPPQSKIWPIYSGQVCLQGQPPFNQIQFLESSTRCFQRGLESRQQLHGSSSFLDSSNHLENHQEPSEGFIDYSQLEQLLVVSTTAKNLSRDRIISSKDAYQQAIIRAIEKLKMDRVLSSERRTLVTDGYRCLCIETKYSSNYIFNLWRRFKRYQNYRFWYQLPFTYESAEEFIYHKLDS
ncbi:hypothetical protein FDP41_013244 [Naegleria fowleri]|uniref:Reverse transcriptase domain-containing protein n=1 Tax=Naegleria fowleri TaxID=5763 RepID=A0A6A5C1B9_NAEFO|nr:uncharacterized protein FDP41_013244 [Naegleria fowleri]KAF0980761.1 hypothetical protein FDP41_013244 [Naegleria fowleri]